MTKLAAINAQIDELLRSRGAILRQIRKDQLADGATMAVYADADFKKYGARHTLFGSNTKGNLVIPGQLNPDIVNTHWGVGSILVGGTVETLKAWARQAQATFNVAQRPYAHVALWEPPDAVLTPAEVRGLVARAESPEHGKNAGDVPDDWRFLAWDICPAVEVAQRQNFDVRMSSWVPPEDPKDGSVPEGQVRVILGGALREPSERGFSTVQFQPISYFDTLDVGTGGKIAFDVDNIGNNSRCNADIPGIVHGGYGKVEVSEFLVGGPNPNAMSVGAVLEVNGAPYTGALATDDVETVLGWRFRRYRLDQILVNEECVPVRVRLRNTTGHDPGSVRVLMKGYHTRDIL